MERTEIQVRDVSVRLGNARRIDPLVLNLDGGTAGFEGTHVFDLDADGQGDTLARLAAGSAYLALDRDGSGRIEDGRELFGPTTGDGFGELRGHDDDGNGWIDEADPVYADLRLWTPRAGGAGPLSSLKSAAVGAIYLGAVATPFEVKQDGTTAAHVVESGVFLREDGTAGTVQHVDLEVIA